MPHGLSDICVDALNAADDRIPPPALTSNTRRARGGPSARELLRVRPTSATAATEPPRKSRRRMCMIASVVENRGRPHERAAQLAREAGGIGAARIGEAGGG